MWSHFTATPQHAFSCPRVTQNQLYQPLNTPAERSQVILAHMGLFSYVNKVYPSPSVGSKWAQTCFRHEQTPNTACKE